MAKKSAKKSAKKDDKAAAQPAKAAGAEPSYIAEKRSRMVERRGETARPAFDPGLLTKDGIARHFYAQEELLAHTTKVRLVTGITDIDILCPPTAGSMNELIGEPGTGKSTTLYWIMGQMQRHCRACQTRIVTWVHPTTGEQKVTCWCGKNDPMVGLHIESELNFPGSYAKTWGVQIGTDIAKRDAVDGSVVSASPLLWVAFPDDGEEALDICIRIVDEGMVDFITVDSLAALLPRAHRDSYLKAHMQVGAHAKLVRTGLTKLAHSMSSHVEKYGVAPMMVWTNHFTMDLKIANPKQDPRMPRGGTGAKYFKSSSISVTSAGRHVIDTAMDTQSRVGLAYLEPRFTVQKSRYGTEKGKGDYRLFNSNFKSQYFEYSPGTVDSAEKLAGYLTTLGYIVKDDAKKAIRFKDPYFGATFKRRKDLIAHFTRMDVYLRGVFLVAKLKLPDTSAEALYEEAYYYPPWREETRRADKPEPESGSGPEHDSAVLRDVAKAVRKQAAKPDVEDDGGTGGEEDAVFDE